MSVLVGLEARILVSASVLISRVRSPTQWVTKVRRYIIGTVPVPWADHFQGHTDHYPVRRRIRQRKGLHRESKKTIHLTLAHNFTKYWPIFKILSLFDSVENL